MNNFDLKHGDERNRAIPVNNGKTENHRREKFCASHGWIGVFAIDGELKWEQAHGKCAESQREKYFISRAVVEITSEKHREKRFLVWLMVPVIALFILLVKCG